MTGSMLFHAGYGLQIVATLMGIGSLVAALVLTQLKMKSSL